MTMDSVTEPGLVVVLTVVVGFADSAIGLADLAWPTEPVDTPVDAVMVSMTSALAESAVTVVDFAESAVVTTACDAVTFHLPPLQWESGVTSIGSARGQ